MTQPGTPPVVRIVDHPLTCDDCGALLGTLGFPEGTPDDHVASKSRGHLCEGCAGKRRDAWQAQYDSDRAAVEAKNLDPDQARIIRASSTWDALPAGKKDAVQAVIDASTRGLL